MIPAGTACRRHSRDRRKLTVRGHRTDGRTPASRKGTPMTDRVNITAAADEHTETAREEFNRGEFEPLDIAVWRRADMPDLYQVEFLLTCGGPTVRVTVDEQGGVEFFHSWGVVSFGGQVHARTRCDFRSEDAEFWRDLAAEFAEAQV